MAPPRRTAPEAHCRRRTLTAREIEVLVDWIWFGEEATARRLGITVYTVRAHVENARSKYGVSTVTQLVHVLQDKLPLPNGIPKLRE